MCSTHSKSPHCSRKEALIVTAQKKRECNSKALKIVETLLEEKVTVEWLLENVKYIAQSHLQDAIEERAISKICGYPICSNSLGNIPRQQFHISTKTNKVYDITERKHFCSNYCYKAAQYLKGQLLTSPVWLRDSEIIPNFHLLSCYSPGEHLGEEVELRHDPIKVQESEKGVSKTGKTGTFVNNSRPFIQFQQQVIENEDELNSKVEAETFLTNRIHQISNRDNAKAMVPINIQTQNEIKTEIAVIAEKSVTSIVQGYSDIKSQNSPPLQVKKTNDCSSDVSSVMTKLDNKTLSSNDIGKGKRQVKSSHNSKKDSKSITNQVNFVSRIEASFKAWFTLESFFYIYGNEKAKELMKDKRQCLKEYYKGVEQTLWEPATQAKYLALCKKLNLMELAEESTENGKQGGSKPLPNFDILKRDAESMELKVREFYVGKATDDMNTSKSTVQSEGDNSCVLPLVELHAQNALRRRIVLDRLRHVLPDLLRTFGMTSRDISGDVRCLVTTFALGADNIMFKPAEWNLIGLIIIKMLSMKDPKLKTLMETQMAQKYTSMMLMGFQLDGGYLERLITWLADIDILLGKTYFNV